MSMTKEEFLDQVKAMTAFFNGKAVESKSVGGQVYYPDENPSWNFAVRRYRVKPPEPDLIPWEAIDKRFKWCARESDGDLSLFTHKPILDEEGVWVLPKGGHVGNISHIAYVNRGFEYYESLQERPK